MNAVVHPIRLAAIQSEHASMLDDAALVANSDEGAERAVLAAIIFHGALDEAQAVVEARMFYYPAHVAVFCAVEQLVTSQQPIDEQTIASALDRQGKLASIGGIEFVFGLRGATPNADHVRAHAKIVAGLYMQRRVVHAAMGIVSDGLAGRSDPQAFVNRSVKRIVDSVERVKDTRLVQMYDVVDERVRAWQTMRERGYVGGLHTGIASIDKRTDGLARPGLSVLSAGTGVGKSILGWAIATSVADAREEATGRAQGVVYVSGEMSAQQMHDRAICARAGCSLRELRRVCMGASDFDDEAPISRDDRNAIESNVLQAQNWLAARPLFLFARAADLQDIRGAIRDAQRELTANAMVSGKAASVVLVVVDYIQMMGLAKADRHDLALSQFASGLAQIGGESNVAMVALAQTNDAPNKRDGGGFRNTDLKNASSMADPASLVAFLERPGMSKKTAEARKKWANYAELNITKGRDHAQGKIRLFIDGARFSIRDPKPREFDALVSGDDDDEPQVATYKSGPPRARSHHETDDD